MNINNITPQENEICEVNLINYIIKTLLNVTIPNLACFYQDNQLESDQ